MCFSNSTSALHKPCKVHSRVGTYWSKFWPFAVNWTKCRRWALFCKTTTSNTYSSTIEETLTRLSTWKWKISNVSPNKLQQPPLTTHLCIDNFCFEELYHVMKRNSYAGCCNDRQLFVFPPQRCTPGWTQAAYSLKHSIAQNYLLYIPHHIPMCWVVMDWTHTQGVLQPTGSSSKSTCGYWKDICLQTMTFWNYSWL